MTLQKNNNYTYLCIYVFTCCTVDVIKKFDIQNKSHQHLHVCIPRLIFANVILWLHKKKKHRKKSHFS